MKGLHDSGPNIEDQGQASGKHTMELQLLLSHEEVEVSWSVYTVHQVAKYSTELRQGHDKAIVYIMKCISRPRITSAFASSLTLPKASNAITMQISQAIGTSSLQKLTLALQHLGVAGHKLSSPQPKLGT
eukprot:CCRYP_012902-RA/>CCRYP_012902-RA protein AED:0.43 eAED:0.40 QI:0/0/0/1/0/0/3/0/129